MVDYGLKDKVAIITGANNPWGIGAATALAFAREGAKVVLIYKKIDRPFDVTKTAYNGADRYYVANAGNADEVEAKLKEINADYVVLESDISDETCVKSIFSQVLNKYGKVDILLNNAATDDETGCDTIETITLNVIDDTFAVNVRGSILMTREFIRNRGDFGRIINEEFEKVVVPLIPMGKLIQPEDIAEAVLFLSSNQAKMITGQVIKVSGGKAL